MSNTLVSIFFLISFMPVVFARTYSIGHIDGKVKVNEQAAELGQVLHQGAIVSAGPESYLDIVSDVGDKVRLKAGSLKIESVKKESSMFDLLSGVLFTYIRPDQDHKFEVRSKTAVMGVRGTKFFIAREPHHTYLCVCEGLVEASKGSMSYLVKPKQDLFAYDSEPLLKPHQASKQMYDLATKEFASMGLPLR